MKLQALMFFSGICEATRISSWNQPSCTDTANVRERRPAPFKCYYYGASSSLKVQDLKSRDTYKIFSDSRCRNLVNVIGSGENDACKDLEFMSAAYVPVVEIGDEREITMPDDEVEILQQEIVLSADGLLPTTQSLQQWFAQGAVPLKGGSR